MLKKKNGAGVIKKKCFFITPIDDKNSPFRMKMAFVKKYILEPVFGDSYEITVGTPRSAVIMPAIVQHIFESDLIVSDLSGWNVNVAYETGLAHTLGKPTIHLLHGDIQKSDPLPFDFRGLKVISYPYTEGNDAKSNLVFHKDGIKTAQNTIKNLFGKVFSNSISDVLSHSSLSKYFVGKFNSDKNFPEIYDFLHEVMSNTMEQLSVHSRNASTSDKLVAREQQLFFSMNKLCEYLHGSRRFNVVDQFVIYCTLCESMVDRADPQDEKGIITVQTPVKTDDWDGDYEIAYESYITTTIRKIVDTKMRYKRIVIANDDLDKERIKKFVTELTDYAKEKKKKSLNNVWIGFVHPSKVYYSNIDFHITSGKDCSIAFLSKIKPKDFNYSIHLHDLDSQFPEDMRKEMMPLWDIDEGNVIKINKYYSSSKTKKTIANAICNKIDDIIKTIT